MAIQKLNSKKTKIEPFLINPIKINEGEIKRIGPKGKVQILRTKPIYGKFYPKTTKGKLMKYLGGKYGAPKARLELPYWWPRNFNPGELMIINPIINIKGENEMKKLNISKSNEKKNVGKLNLSKKVRMNEITTPCEIQETVTTPTPTPMLTNSIKRTRGIARKNPVVMGIDIGQIFTGGLASIATMAAPRMLKMSTPATKYGTEFIVSISGKWLVDKFTNNKYGNTWLTVGLSLMAADLLKEYFLSKVTLLTNIGLIEVPSGEAKTVSTTTQIPLTNTTNTNVLPNSSQSNSNVPVQTTTPSSGLGAYLNRLPKNYVLGSRGRVFNY